MRTEDGPISTPIGDEITVYIVNKYSTHRFEIKLLSYVYASWWNQFSLGEKKLRFLYKSHFREPTTATLH